MHALHNERLRDLDVQEVQFDEMGSFVGKKQTSCDELDAEDDDKGDPWDHTAVDVDSRLVVALSVGTR